MFLLVLMHFYPRNGINLWLLQNSLSIQTLSAASRRDGSRGGSALSLSSLHFISVTDVGSSLPLLPPTTWYDWTTDNIVLGSNLHYTTGIVFEFRWSELIQATDVVPVVILLMILISHYDLANSELGHMSVPTSFPQPSSKVSLGSSLHVICNLQQY